MKQVRVSDIARRNDRPLMEVPTKDRFCSVNPADQIGRPGWPEDDQFCHQSREDDAINCNVHGRGNWPLQDIQQPDWQQTVSKFYSLFSDHEVILPLGFCLVVWNPGVVVLLRETFQDENLQFSSAHLVFPVFFPDVTVQLVICSTLLSIHFQ